MNLWQQNYDPAGNIWLSSLIASLPILFFFFALINLFRFTVKHSLIFTCMVGVITTLQAYVLTWMIP
ncbi:hypothetical protein [Escherichia coli]|uniref:hypothetical protein n=1 Tax=Escherichia coli TaxID=562 RepID=UPI0018E8EA2B|nr:hypothetical protein JFX55_016320 [Escherichia coli]